MLLKEAIGGEVIARILDESQLLGGSEYGIELPNLSAGVIVEAPQPRLAAPFRDPQPPHSGFQFDSIPSPAPPRPDSESEFANEIQSL